MQATEELLNRQFKDLANHNEISLLKSKVRTLEQKLIESETQTSSLQSKLQNLQKDLKSVIKERDVLTDGKEEKEANAEKYRTMKIKALKVLIKFFSVETPKVLHLRYLEIDNSFIPIIGNMLKRHPSIESLDLEGNFLTDEGAKLISEIISYSDSNISDINLSYNKISTEGAWLIVQAMKIRDETKFKKVKSVNLIHNLIEKPADIFLKAWDYFKPIRDFFPQNNLKAAELRRVSNSTATKIFSTAVGNIKEVQDLIEVIERIKVVDVQEGKRQL